MGADGQVVGTALTATIGSLILLSAGFFIWRKCGPGRPYFKRGGNEDDYYLSAQQSAVTSGDKGKGDGTGKGDEEMGMGGGAGV